MKTMPNAAIERRMNREINGFNDDKTIGILLSSNFTFTRFFPLLMSNENEVPEYQRRDKYLMVGYNKR